MAEQIDWRTPAEKAKDEENARLGARFRELVVQAPSVSRAIAQLAKEEGLNKEALRVRMVRIGVIIPGRRCGRKNGVKVL